MPEHIQSPGLRSFLLQEMKEDPNATLGSALKHLQELCDEAPPEAVSIQREWVLELSELLEQSHRYKGLEDLLRP